MLVLFAALASWPRAFELSTAYTFEAYTADFGKRYSSAREEADRRAIFNARLQSIVAHNSRRPAPRYLKGVGELTDRTDAERAALLGGRGITATTASALTNVTSISATHRGRRPAAVDWRACSPYSDSELCPLGARPAAPIVTAVKNQGHCGSCWAFASTAALEAHLSLATGRHETLSPQHLVSCAPNDDKCGGTGGCAGSTADVAYTWLAKSGGLASAFSYGYSSGTEGASGKCDVGRTAPLAALTGIAKPRSNDYEALLDAVATAGPVAVNVYASAWHDYESGVYDGCGYDADIELNHVVVLEGYGTDAATGDDYWLIRNSWSTSFGELGYIRLLREKSPMCATDSTPGSGWDCAPYPKRVSVCGQCGVAYQPTYPVGVTVAA